MHFDTLFQVLGSGYVAAPLVDYLTRPQGGRASHNSVTVASLSLEQATAITQHNSNARPLQLDATDLGRPTKNKIYHPKVKSASPKNVKSLGY